MKTLHTIYSTFAKHNMAKFLTVLTILFTVGVGSILGAEYETPFTITSDAVVSGSGYTKYTYTDASSRGWIITYGGNNKSVGTNSSNRNSCKLTNYSKYAVSPVTTSSIASAFVSTTSLTDIGKISYTFNGGSNQTKTNVYLIYSSDNNTFSQISLSTGTQGAIISSETSYTFAKKTGYFGLLFVATNTSGNWRIDDVNISFYKEKESTPSHTITAQSNNTNYGTVSLTGTIITASPKTGYRVSTTNPYSISPSTSATVEQSGNTFTVTPSADTEITINFEAIPTHKVHFNTSGLVDIESVDVQEGATYNITQTPAASLTQECEYNTFVGWTESNTIANPSSKPTIVNSIKMGSSDITLYAVYSKTEGGGGSAAEQGTTMFSENWKGCTNNTQPDQPTTSGSAVYNDADIDYVWYTPSGGSKTQTYTSGGPNSNENILISKNNGYWKVVGIPTGQAETLTLSSSKSGSGVLSVSTSTSNVSISGSTITIGSSSVNTFDLIFTNTKSDDNLRLDDISVVVAKAGATGTTTYSLTPNCTTTQTATYTVNHYQQNITDDNYTLKETQTLSGEVGTKVTPAFKSYEGFTAPTEEKSVEITADGKAIVEYQYARKSYTLTWNLDDGTITTAGTPEGEVKYGASLTAPVVKKDGFNFKGWNPEVPNTMPAASATYTAQWKKKHTIKWIVNGDTDTPYATTYVVDGDALALPRNPDAPSTCEEKVFIGWTESTTVNADGSDIEYVDENTLPNTDKTYYAVFASPDANGAGGEYKKVTSALSDWSGEYLIVYETGKIAFDGGQAEDKLEDGDHISVTIEDNAIAATTEMDNARFTVAKMTGGYSVKSASGYYIGCEANDKGLYPSQDIQYLNQIFWGKPWDSAEEGVIIKSQNDPILLYSITARRFRYYSSAQEPIALYRKSSYTDYTTVCVETYNVIYDANGATSGNIPVDENNYILDATVTVLGNTGNLQKTHYSFVEWNTQADGNGNSYQAGETFTIREDITLYAIWEELPQYSVTWYVNGKQLTDVELNGASTTVYEGDRITKTPPAPNPEDFCGQVFAGWTDAEMDVNDTDEPTIYNLVDEFPTASGDQTFYAVFADYKD